MEILDISKDYIQAVKAIKQAILESRYRAARQVNKEVLALNYSIGRFISLNTRFAKWGINAVAVISKLLQQELPGVKGYSEASIKMMRIFYEEWESVFENRQSTIDDFANHLVPTGLSGGIEIRPLTTDELSESELKDFLNVGFTNHYIILTKTSSLTERLFYIRRCALGFWSGKKLKYYINDNLYAKEGSMPNNFSLTTEQMTVLFGKSRSTINEHILNIFKEGELVEEDCMRKIGSDFFTRT